MVLTHNNCARVSTWSVIYTSTTVLALRDKPSRAPQGPNKFHPLRNAYRDDIAICDDAAARAGNASRWNRMYVRLDTSVCVCVCVCVCASFAPRWPLPQSVFVLLLDRVISLNRPPLLASRSHPLRGRKGWRTEGGRERERERPSWEGRPEGERTVK